MAFFVSMEPFKNVFNRDAISMMGRVLAARRADFSAKKFTRLACRDLEALELKQRSSQIFQALDECLPPCFEKAAALIIESLHPSCDANSSGEGVTEEGIQGWLIMPLAEYTGQRGHGHFLLAMDLFQQLTMRFTAEFAIRHMILAHPEKTLATLMDWTSHDNHHVRRLVSEGSRPRLPWAMQLPQVIADPQLTLPLLEALRDDPSEYVRRSVANHLNDIAKDHPQMILDLATAWHKNAPPERVRLLRHAMRNLLKQGHEKALKLHGISAPKLADVSLEILSSQVPFHGDLRFSLQMRSTAKRDQKIRIDLIVHYQKANGKLAPKTYLWKEFILSADAVHRAERTQSFRAITTRVYHRGLHRLEVRANGVALAIADFHLI
jgi:3-methyladenine DNA glycosylase AlkC